ncbi:MAG: hypothetical protein CO135_02615 [Candidatus Levybacteria bacterium CG_4_9_14_3_um_filter_35_16]|nr:MAG: hypothetical protein COW87_02380 [Candidatus Levybacteria bacterium CG22_combo_CG10-13_8_21_14_all_35_11]PIY94408.1 MAG: hypothetical protein COY68_02505 [Candidatus Levybacteria bacterium CG_4_10_14_0_8_um_filter_35_23]PJA91155.1 MAG: hypothetical protein CO135_02615 [Candidatus Levybacteria bacterium CG_4_9_14_3_um_filter_35_16]PJC54033.1 MAG: hypothetical protein CO028_04445 [Candidatus Levybacteria bacterium CG_4_9_14_0_2_um_filter_35_21]
MVYSQKDKVSLLGEIERALSDIVFGSVELYVSDRKVTQITVRNIRKTSMEVGQAEKKRVQNIQNITISSNSRIEALKSTKNVISPE